MYCRSDASRMRRLYYRWLMLCGAAHVLLGLAFIGFMESPWAAGYVQHWVATLSLADVGHGVVPTLQFLGPTVASWGVLFCVALRGYWLTGARSMRWGLMAAIAVWFVADTGLSIWHGLVAHYAINAGALLALWLPVWLLRVAPPPG
jgi:uncharacterized protein